jgi:hypothetical protein
MEEYKLKTS